MSWTRIDDNGMRVMNASDMGIQLMSHPGEPHPSRMTTLENWAHKPCGGMWTSTLIGDNWSDWLGWCQENAFGDWRWYPRYLLEPIDTRPVLVVDCLLDLKKICDRYEIHDIPEHDLPAWMPAHPRPDLDFVRMAQDGYIGFHLTICGERLTRTTTPGLNGWDCESTVWFTWPFSMDKREAASGEQILPDDGLTNEKNYTIMYAYTEGLDGMDPEPAPRGR